ncbi:MAG: exodeoxyribonuclease V subunit alpha [Gammaproteobacteria bacterium]|nr:exodeoxyribonuclease V subunit alpha [Gammaproteobacteria bacterium]
MSYQSELGERDSAIGYLFARFIAEQAGQPERGTVARTAAWLADIQMQGDVCLDLAVHAATPWPNQKDLTPDLERWCRELRETCCVGKPGELAPLTLDGSKLYLNRFWRYENGVASSIITRLNQPQTINRLLLQQGLQRLFGEQKSDTIDWQMLAAALATTRQFSVISGGPGTGKTASLVKVLVLLLEQQPKMVIRMAAPTGKAAARMVESIRAAKADVKTDETIRARIPDQALTLHRLLGFSPRGYRHDKHNPLILDCLVIDEASMVDLPMMARLLEALPDTARLMMLGDRDQLASVDAGNVLGDITGHGHEIAYSLETARELADLTGSDLSLLPIEAGAPKVANAIALLRKSYRFKAESGIGRLAYSINSGNAKAAVELLSQAAGGELEWLPETPLNALLDQIIGAYTPYLQTQSVGEAMQLFEKQRVLCAVRQGPVGVVTINQMIASRLQRRGLLGGGDAVQGVPVMVTGNNYELGLFNGDVGLLWRNAEGNLRAYFRQSDNELRDIPAQTLPQHELSWAMTVHKSQGSEFERVILLLPEVQEGGAVLTRELLYTAVTRAKKQFTLYGKSEAVNRAVMHTVQRSTGLASRLQWPSV